MQGEKKEGRDVEKGDLTLSMLRSLHVTLFALSWRIEQISLVDHWVGSFEYTTYNRTNINTCRTNTFDSSVNSARYIILRFHLYVGLSEIKGVFFLWIRKFHSFVKPGCAATVSDMLGIHFLHYLVCTPTMRRIPVNSKDAYNFGDATQIPWSRISNKKYQHDNVVKTPWRVHSTWQMPR